MITLTYRTPYDWESMVAFLARRAIPRVEGSDGSTWYGRSAEVGGRSGSWRVTHDAKAKALQLSLSESLMPAEDEIAGRVRHLFDLEAEPRSIAKHLARDPLLAPLVAKRPGLRLPRAWDPFEIAIRAIVGQQVSVAAARNVLGTITERYGTRVSGEHSLFPLPSKLAHARELPMPGRRAETIRRLSAAVDSGELILDASCPLEERLARLRAIGGIGPWTASYIAMRAFGDSDAFPAGDLILRRAAGNVTAAQLERRAEAWRPWRAYAVLHLWAG